MKEHFLNPEILAQIDNFSLLAKTVVEGFISGLHKSLYHGFGTEFVHYRHYYPGDDLKYVDWNVYARLGRFQIKVFQEETNCNCYIVLDTSASMGYQGRNRSVSKIHFAKMIVACLSYLISRQGDNVGFYAYDGQIRVGIKPSHRGGQVQNICNKLATIDTSGSCDHKGVLHRLAEMLQRRGIIIFISDFLDVDEALRKAIRYFRVSHHDCILFHILDDDELKFPFTGNVRFIDCENSNEINTAPNIVRDRYLNSFNKFLVDFEDACLKDNVDYFRFSTSQSLENILAAYLHRREIFR